MTVVYCEPIRSFDREEEKIIERIRGHDFTPVVFRLPAQARDRFSCHFRHSGEQCVDLPPTTYGQTSRDALQNGLDRLTGLSLASMK